MQARAGHVLCIRAFGRHSPPGRWAYSPHQTGAETEAQRCSSLAHGHTDNQRGVEPRICLQRRHAALPRPVWAGEKRAPRRGLTTLPWRWWDECRRWFLCCINLSFLFMVPADMRLPRAGFRRPELVSGHFPDSAGPEGTAAPSCSSASMCFHPSRGYSGTEGRCSMATAVAIEVGTAAPLSVCPVCLPRLESFHYYVEYIHLKQKCGRFPIWKIKLPHIISVFHFMILAFYQGSLRNF